MKDLTDVRKMVDDIDAQILRLFTLRMNAVTEIAEIKAAENIRTPDTDREADILRRAISSVPSEYVPCALELFEKLLEISRNYQEQKRGL